MKWNLIARCSMQTEHEIVTTRRDEVCSLDDQLFSIAICGKLSKVSFDGTEGNFSSQEQLSVEFTCLVATQDGVLQSGSDSKKWNTSNRQGNNTILRAIRELVPLRYSPWCQIYAMR